MASSTRVTVFGQLSRLPVFNPSALKVIALSSESDSAMDDFEHIFQSDAALTADLLLTANSAAFGLRKRVETIRHALSLLGLERVRGLAMNIMLAAYVRRQPAEHVRPIWSHSVATAVIAEALGDTHAFPGLYTLGLMHDLGRLALLSSRGTLYGEALESESSDMNEALEIEAALFGMDHCDAGALLARTWGFPERFQVCMAAHHESAANLYKGPVGVIQTACCLADRLGYPEIRRHKVVSSQPSQQDLRNISQFESERVLERIRQQTATLVC